MHKFKIVFEITTVQTFDLKEIILYAQSAKRLLPVGSGKITVSMAAVESSESKSELSIFGEKIRTGNC